MRLRKLIAGAIGTVLVGIMLVVWPSSPAAAIGDSGSKNCVGSGFIVPTIDYQPYYGGTVAVKKAGPPSGPTWGDNLPKDSVVPGVTWAVAFVSPYSEGTWSVNGPGDAMRAIAQCSVKAARAGTPDVTRFLGDKTCANKGAVVEANAGGETWVTWRSSANGPFRRVRFDTGWSVFNYLNTRDTAIFDVRIDVYGAETLNGYQFRCGL